MQRSEEGKRHEEDYLHQTEVAFGFKMQSSGIFAPEDREKPKKVELDNVKVDAKVSLGELDLRGAVAVPQPSAERSRGSFQDVIANAISTAALTVSVVSVGVSILTLAFLIYGAFIAKGQWDEMRKATKASADSAKTATEALKENKEQFARTERPWIGIENISFNDYSVAVPDPKVPHMMRNDVALTMSIAYTFKNTGQSPALDVIPSFAITAFTESVHPPGFMPPKCKMPDRSRPLKPNEPAFFIMPGGTADHREDVAVDVEPHRGQPDTLLGVQLQVCISYRDQLDNQVYWTKQTYFANIDPDSEEEIVPRTDYHFRRVKSWWLYKGEAK